MLEIQTEQCFGVAIEAAKKGGSFRLPSWSPEVAIKLHTPEKIVGELQSNPRMTHPYLYVVSRYGLVPWIPTMVEMLSDHWEVTANGK